MRGCAERAARRAWKLSRPESAQNKKKKAAARARLQAAAGDFHIAVNPAALNSDLAAFVSLTAPALSTAGVLLDGALPPSAPPPHTHPSPLPTCVADSDDDDDDDEEPDDDDDDDAADFPPDAAPGPSGGRREDDGPGGPGGLAGGPPLVLVT